MQQKCSITKKQLPLNIANSNSEALYTIETYLNWLTKLYRSIENNQKQLIKITSALKLTEIQTLLQLYSEVDVSEIKYLKGKITEINEQLSLNDSLNQQIVFIIQALSIDPHTKSISILVNPIFEIVRQQNQLLIIAHQFCELFIHRKEKKFPLALIKVEELIQNIKSFCNKEQGYYATLATKMLANSYTQKAKIHRSLAGTDLDALGLNQLQLAQECYEFALRLTNDHRIMTCLGFLLNDQSDRLPTSEREKMLQQALKYHDKAKLFDPNSPDINHGIALDLYKLLKLQKEIGQPLDSNKLERAFDAFLITEHQNPNARLYHDRGLLHQLVGNEQQALLEFRRGLILEPHHLLLHYARGLLYFKMGEYLPALQDFHLGYMLSDTSVTFKKKFAIEIDNTKRKLLTDNKGATPCSFSESTPKMIPLNSDIRKIALEAEYQNALRYLSTYAHPKRPIKVFISYAWGISEHESLVERIVNELSQAGLYVLYDKREERKGKHIMEFIDKMISEADFIIVIGSKLYLKKYYYRTANPDEYDHVVATEGAIASYRVLSNRLNSEKIIPVMIEGPASAAFPPALLPKLAVNLWERDWHLEMFSLISSLYRIPYGDEKFVKIMQQFSDAVKNINHEKMDVLAKKYRAPLYKKISQLTFFQSMEDLHLVSFDAQSVQFEAKL